MYDVPNEHLMRNRRVPGSDLNQNNGSESLFSLFYLHFFDKSAGIIGLTLKFTTTTSSSRLVIVKPTSISYLLIREYRTVD